MTESQSLDDLIRLIGDGDLSAIGALYEEMRLPLLRKILSRFGSTLSEQDAEDVIHYTFLKIPQYAKGYKGAYNDASAKNWIYKIAKSKALKMIKAMERLPTSLDDPPQDDDSGDRSVSRKRNALFHDQNWERENSVEERAERASVLKKIFAIPQLTLEEREILALRYGYGYTFEELGGHMGRSKPRAKQRLDGIIDKIRKALKVNFSKK